VLKEVDMRLQKQRKKFVKKYMCALYWIIDHDNVHTNDLGHRIIANKVFEAIVRNCSFVARTMPETTLIREFFSKYGNGPERPSTHLKTNFKRLEGVSPALYREKQRVILIYPYPV
jgi:hypothetical protein